MAEEYSLSSNPELDNLLTSFLNCHVRVFLSLKNGGGTLEHIEIAVHALVWADSKERRQLEIRGYTSAGRRYRGSINFALPDRSGIILDPDD